ncbi:MAG: ribonuclease HII, partial [Eggerthellaceae bacterium]|nr:ribonuclease HII [Eggerthellaceae bacterium]
IQQADEDGLLLFEEQLQNDERKGVHSVLARRRKALIAEKKERERLVSLYDCMNVYAKESFTIGCDEVGRGPVAGPLTVAAVVLSDDVYIEGLNDSKKISPKRREKIAEHIRNEARAWHIMHISPAEIDNKGMAACLRKAFYEVASHVQNKMLPEKADAILLDGNALHIFPHEYNIVKGDSKVANIAAASIIAKVERDALMIDYARNYPEYGFDENKGYASPAHIDAIKRYGLTPLHRKTFCSAWI